MSRFRAFSQPRRVSLRYFLPRVLTEMRKNDWSFVTSAISKLHVYAFCAIRAKASLNLGTWFYEPHKFGAPTNSDCSTWLFKARFFFRHLRLDAAKQYQGGIKPRMARPFLLFSMSSLYEFSPFLTWCSNGRATSRSIQSLNVFSLNLVRVGNHRPCSRTC